MTKEMVKLLATWGLIGLGAWGVLSLFNSAPRTVKLKRGRVRRLGKREQRYGRSYVNEFGVRKIDRY